MVEGVRLRVRAWLRGRWRSAALVALLAGIAAGTVLTLAAGARRTGSAADRYTEAFGGDPDLILVQPFGPPLTDAVDAVPGVEDVEAITFVTAFPVGPEGFEGDPNPFAGDDGANGARVIEGRFTDPEAPDELTVNRNAAEVLGVEVGDQLHVLSFSQSQVENNEFRPGITPLGPTFDATVVGVVERPNDLDDQSPTLLFSRALLETQPDLGVVATFMVVRIDPAADSAAVRTAIQGVAGDVPLVEGESRIVTGGARRAIDLHTTALWIVSAVAGVVAVLILVQLAARQRRSGSGDDDALRILGYGRRQMAIEAAAEAALVGVAAAAVAIGIAVAGSALFPLGVMKTVEPDPGPAVDGLAMFLGALGIVIVFATAATATALRTSRHHASGRIRAGLPELAAAAGAGPTVVNGMRFAASSAGPRRGRPVALAATVGLAIAGLVGSLLVATSLVRMTGVPAIWGADYDAVYGNPFVPAPTDLVTPASADADIAGLTAATDGVLTIDGSDVSVWAYEPIRGGVLPTLLAGRLPSAPDEIALGRVLAGSLDRAIGDTVTAEGTDGHTAELRVVGYAINPQYAGEGAAIQFEAYEGLVSDASRNLIVVNYREGADIAAVEQRLEAVVYTPPDTSALPPTTVQAFDRVLPAPYALAVVLALMVATTLGYHLATSVRRRARDLAILRAIGADRRQLRSTVHWQACCVALVGLVIGIPVGLAVGGRIYDAIADSVGVVPTVTVPVLVVVAVAAGVLVVANLAAMAPARRATRVTAAAMLQEGAASGQ